MEGLDSKNDRFRDLETLESDDKRRQRSSKSKISGGSGEGEESDGSRKRTGGSRRSDYDSDDYEARKELRSKQIMKKQEDNSTLEKLSSWYEDGDRENKREGGYVRKSISKFSDKGMDDDRSRDRDRDRETVYLEREQNDQDKGRVSSEQGRSHKNRWEDTDAVRNTENVKFVGNLDIKRGKFTDIKPESAEELSIPEKEYGLSSPGERGVKSIDRDAERVDSEDRTRSRDKLDAPEGDNKAQIEQQERSLVNRDDAETRERSKSPLRTGSGHHERDRFDLDHERGIVSKRKEPEREGYRDDWSKPRSHEREWDVGHRHGRYGGRRDMSVKTSSMYGVSDVIEIQTKPFDRRNEPPQQSETKSGPIDNSSSIRYSDEGPSPQDQNSSRDENDFQKGQRNNTMSSRNVGGVEPGSPFNRGAPQGNRGGRGGRGRPAGRERESQQPYGVPMPMMGSSFGPIGMVPPGPMQPLNPSMSPSPVGPPMPPNIFMPTFPPMMNFLAVPPNLSPVPPGSSGPRFSSSIGNPTNPPFIFNQPSNISAPGVNAMVPFGRGQNQDKGSPYEFPTRTIRPPGKAPSRGEQNDYSQNFVDTGMRPQNFIRELELTAVVEDYPRLRELIQKKDEIVANAATAPMYHKCDLREHVLSPEFFGTKFDVILVDPPWEEYVHRAPGVTDHMEYWTFEEIMNLKIEAIADTPSFIFLWVGDGVGLEQGRQCLKKWGFRRCEDICWVKTNKTNATPGLRHDSHTLFQRSKEHCLMGIKGTVRRSTDGHVIHANIDTDVIIAEEPPYGSTAKPEDMYRIVEHFALGRRRLELFGEDHNIRSGWLTVGKGLSSSNFNAEGYIKNFADKDGKVWQGGGGRNPPPEAPHLVVTTPDIEALRPKSPMKNQMQLQQQSNSISIPTVNNTPNRIPTINQEASTSSFSTPGPWTNMEPFKGGNMGNEDRNFDVYGYNMNSGQSYEEYRDFESRRGMNLL